MKLYYSLFLLMMVTGCFNQPEKEYADILLEKNKDSEHFQLSEEDGWMDFENVIVDKITITKTEVIKIGELVFIVLWDKKLSYSDNMGSYYGGIKKLKISLNNQLINEFDSIEDIIALGEINIWIYDFNFDGFMDFTIPKECGRSCVFNYYIFNPELNKFELKDSWDSLRIQKINKITKEILAHPELRDGRIMYKVDGLNLKKIKQEASYE